MPYNEEVVNALRSAVGRLPLSAADQLSERRMFGGLSMLLNGKMLAGVIDSRIVIRLSDEELSEALKLPYVSPMDFTGKPMRNFAFVNPAGFATDEEWSLWIEKSLEYVRGHMPEDMTGGLLKVRKHPLL